MPNVHYISAELLDLATIKSIIEEHKVLELSKEVVLNIEKSKSIKFYKAQLKMCFMHYLYSNIFILPWLITALFNVNFKIKFAFIIITCTVQGKILYKQYMWYTNIHKNEDIIEIEKEIKVLDKSSDTLHELIDNF